MKMLIRAQECAGDLSLLGTAVYFMLQLRRLTSRFLSWYNFFHFWIDCLGSSHSIQMALFTCLSLTNVIKPHVRQNPGNGYL